MVVVSLGICAGLASAAVVIATFLIAIATVCDLSGIGKPS